MIEFIQWIYNFETWIILGIVFIILDVFLGYNFFVLPVGVAALVMAVLLYLQKEQTLGDFVLFETWHGIGMTFAALSVVSIGIIKFGFQRNKDDTPDINEY